MGQPMTDIDCLEIHVLVRMLVDAPGDRHLQEAAWKLVNRLRDQGKICEPAEQRGFNGGSFNG